MGYLPEVAQTLERIRGDLPAADAVLDVGCGTKPYQHLFADWSYLGIDVEHSGRPSSAKTPDRFFDGLHIPFAADAFGLVLCIEVLEHVAEPALLLAEMHRVLRPGGTLVLSTPFLWGEHEAPFDFQRFSTAGLSRTVERAGFTIAELRKHGLGRSALTALLRSEINAAKHSKPGRSRRLASVLQTMDVPLTLIWSTLLTYWESVYGFDRLYVRNVLVARKPPAHQAPAHEAP